MNFFEFDRHNQDQTELFLCPRIQDGELQLRLRCIHRQDGVALTMDVFLVVSILHLGRGRGRDRVGLARAIRGESGAARAARNRAGQGPNYWPTVMK
jgi:hypothetical protein